ncbi:MAG: NADH:flavin oxidoreductase [Candidatus Bathyarchaeota archaeon]|nr:MAG: NADH:flavin oxidoreductase [Candidatus Bathyarchaeota archaeon]
MSVLFEPYRIGCMEIRNRFVRSATTSYWSDPQGVVRPEIIMLYRGLAEGGIGLIVKGHLYVSDSGKAHTGMAGLSSDLHIPKLRELTDAVHEHGKKIVAQLNHAGYTSRVDRTGPSEYKTERWMARALAADEIHGIVDAFGEAARRAMDAGFDGVQIHGAHGYLVSQFLSSLANSRTDEYGGSLENRMRLLNEVYDEIRARVGGCTPVLLKMNCDDFSPEGFTINDSVRVTEAICRRGLDAIEISGGGLGHQEALRTRARSEDPDLSEANFAGHAVKIRAATKPTPLALVNGIRSRGCMEAIIEKDVADLVSMSRPFIREPDLVRLLKAGQPEAKCISCGDCISGEVFGKMMLRCHVE